MMSGLAGVMRGGWAMGWGWLIPVLAIGAIVWAIVAYERSRSDDAPRGRTVGDESLAILRERYANGELDAGTYHRMREELEWRR